VVLDYHPEKLDRNPESEIDTLADVAEGVVVDERNLVGDSHEVVGIAVAAVDNFDH
jgi:hypothetical protein